MCKILMSINPEYVEEILAGRKKFEYRKTKARKKEVDRIVIYSTFPVMKVVAEIEVKGVLEDKPEQLWEKTHMYSGISKDKYDKYFENKKLAYAYELGRLIVYKKPKKLEDIGINYAPQSYSYLD